MSKADHFDHFIFTGNFFVVRATMPASQIYEGLNLKCQTVIGIWKSLILSPIQSVTYVTEMKTNCVK